MSDSIVRVVCLRTTRPPGSDTRAHLRDRAHDLLAHEVGSRAVRRLCPRCGSSAHGRPSVVIPHAPAHQVSLSYAPGLVVVAWTRLAPVGVDIERIDGPSSAGDYGDLATWTRTEALLKATGEGLSRDPLGPPGLPERWSVPLDVGAGLVAHLALDLPPDHSPAPGVEVEVRAGRAGPAC